ncbi:TonB-dependent receptor plug domain-containing protein [Melittangium boletus]|uniref:TonB-dependent receptor plug domain-containing protein n=1 Tax=Melittangium boletus TaxID=83453 RepID=UPI003DA35930
MRGWWLSGVLVVAGPALAQAPGAVGEGEGGRTTVVTGSRSVEHVQDAPVAVEVITRRDIEASGARDVAELLSGRPGVEVMTGFAGAGLRLRGLGPEYSLLLVDGERVAGRVDGQLDLSRLSTDNIGRRRGAGRALGAAAGWRLPPPGRVRVGPVAPEHLGQ